MPDWYCAAEVHFTGTEGDHSQCDPSLVHFVCNCPIYLSDTETSIETSATTANFKEMDSAEDRENVGRWSEEFVDKYLRSRPEEYTDIVWMNKDGESNAPNDFTFKQGGAIY